MKYAALRTVHLLCAVFALPMLLMYGISAVQMAHGRWFTLKPAVTESTVALSPGMPGGRAVAHALMTEQHVAGEITSIDLTPGGLRLRIAVPGTVYDIDYDRATGAAKLRTSTSGALGMMNRLHHAAGLWPGYLPLKFWGFFVAAVSLATVLLAASGLWMWWLRKQERKWGILLLAANLLFSVTVLLFLRISGP